MSGTELINWLVGEAESISDPEFLARCFVLLCILFVFCSIFHDVITMGRK